MSTEVRQHTKYGFFVMATYQYETRYFNSRKFKMTRRLEHYVHPRAHKRDFSSHSTWVSHEPRRWQTELIRFSEHYLGDLWK